MMSFFASPYCAAPAPSETSFTPLFRLLNDFESYQQQLQVAQQHNGTANPTQRRRRASPRPAVQPTFRPKFDIRETEHTYELHGELAGLERDNLEIEFTDPQTLVIRGRVERTYEENKPAAATAEDSEEKDATPATTTTTTNDDADEKTKRRSSYQATVEDDPEEPSTPISTPPESPKTQPADLIKQQKQVQKAPARQAPAPVAPQSKYWLYERSIGQFSRAFEFPTRVEHEGVKATLDNGILTVSVPKAKRHEVRRIAIF